MWARASHPCCEPKKNLANASSAPGVVGHFVVAGLAAGDAVVEAVLAEANIDLALRVLKPGGVLGLEGLTETSVGVDFNLMMEKEIYMKGFNRSSLRAYQTSLNYIEGNRDVQGLLDQLHLPVEDADVAHGCLARSRTLLLQV